MNNNVNVRDRPKAITAEDLIRRYNLDGLKSDRKAIQMNKNGLDRIDKITSEFVDAVLKDLHNIQDQVDGNITTWFFSGEPSIENEPANEWINDADKINHLGDLYYDKETGYAYRFTQDENGFLWIKLQDSDITEALALANSAQDTADSKRRTFVVQPQPPYDVGDIWIKEDKDLYRCRATRKEGEYNEVDWVRATDYSNDDYAKKVEAVLDQFKEEVKSDYVTKVTLETSVDDIKAQVEATTTEIKNTATSHYESYDKQLSELNIEVGEVKTSVSESKITLQGDISNIETNLTDLKNGLQETNKHFDDFLDKDTVLEQFNSVEEKINSNKLEIDVINEITKNGVKKVTTTQGYTFDDNGLLIDNTNSKTKGLFDEKGMDITDKSSGESLLFAGYDEKSQETLVKTKNLTVNKFLNIPHARFEAFKNSKFGDGTGCFWID